MRDEKTLNRNQEQNKVRHGQLPYSSILLTVLAIWANDRSASLGSFCLVFVDDDDDNEDGRMHFVLVLRFTLAMHSNESNCTTEKKAEEKEKTACTNIVVVRKLWQYEFDFSSTRKF